MLDFLFRRRHSELAMPDPESPDFEREIAKTELPGSTGQLGVEPSEWRSAAPPDQKKRRDRS